MWPTVFDTEWLGLTGALSFQVPTYFAAIMTGFAGAVYIAFREAMRMEIDRQKFIDFSIWMLIIGVMGSRFAHVLMDGFFMDYVHLCTDPFMVDGKPLPSGADLCVANSECLGAQDRGFDIGSICNVEDGLCYPQRDCFRWLKFWAGGLTVYGGLISCVLFAYFYMRKFDLPVKKIMDLGGYGMPFGLAVGRLGCLAAGCCYGGICEIEGFGIQFPSGSGAYQEHFEHHHGALTEQWRTGDKQSLPVWPTQYISALYNFGIFLFAYFWVRTRKRFHGQVILTTVFLYASCRFLIEFLRADPRGGAFMFSTSQWIALGTACTAFYVLMRLRKSVDVRAESPADEEE